MKATLASSNAKMKDELLHRSLENVRREAKIKTLEKDLSIITGGHWKEYKHKTYTVNRFSWLNYLSEVRVIKEPNKIQMYLGFIQNNSKMTL